MNDFNTDYFWGHQYLEAMGDLEFIQCEMRNIGILSKWYQRLSYLFRIDEEIGSTDWYIHKEQGKEYLMMRIVILYQRWLKEKKPLLAKQWKEAYQWEKDWKQIYLDEETILAVFKDCES
jgi:hypothetical protein